MRTKVVEKKNKLTKKSIENKLKQIKKIYDKTSYKVGRKKT